ncbi:hypothetical protein APUTEX25_004572, partial [Auxenochlorella protothecoides]
GLAWHMHQKPFRKVRHQAYVGRERAINQLTEQFRAPPGMTTIVGVGNWSAQDRGGIMRGTPPGPWIRFLRRLRRYVRVRNGVEKLVDVWDTKRCTNRGCKVHVVNRDVNGAANMLMLTKCFFANALRPTAFGNQLRQSDPACGKQLCNRRKPGILLHYGDESTHRYSSSRLFVQCAASCCAEKPLAPNSRGGSIFTPNGFESHCGLAHRKKWRTTLRVFEPGKALQSLGGGSDGTPPAALRALRELNHGCPGQGPTEVEDGDAGLLEAMEQPGRGSLDCSPLCHQQAGADPQAEADAWTLIAAQGLMPRDDGGRLVGQEAGPQGRMADAHDDGAGGTEVFGAVQGLLLQLLASTGLDVAPPPGSAIPPPAAPQQSASSASAAAVASPPRAVQPSAGPCPLRPPSSGWCLDGLALRLSVMERGYQQLQRVVQVLLKADLELSAEVHALRSACAGCCHTMAHPGRPMPRRSLKRYRDEGGFLGAVHGA